MAQIHSVPTTPLTSYMNSFGQSHVQGSRSLALFPLYDPRSVREDRARFRRDAVPMLDRANSFYCPAGRHPSRGWILLSRGDLDRLDKYSTTLQLNIGDTKLSTNVGQLKNLCIVQARCVTRGLAADPNALYLVEVTDARGILHNKWFQFPLTTAYNIRVPGYPSTFYLESMKDYDQPNPSAGSKTTWTWTTMLQNMWERMPLLGSWPGLPYAPAGTPEGFWFLGVPAWTAMCDILDYLGLTVKCDLTRTSPFSIVKCGTADTAFAALQLLYTPSQEDDLEWIDVGAGRVPKTIKVLFRRRNTVYGTEETVAYRNDIMAEQWAMKPYYTVSVDAPTTFTLAVGTHYIWSDFTVRYDDSSNPLDADIHMARAIARERVSQYFDRIYHQTSGAMSKTYAGARPFTNGPLVDGVCWTQDYSDQSRQGWRTRIVRGCSPPFPEVYGP